ncbi:putative transpanin [Ixodes scapularis]
MRSVVNGYVLSAFHLARYRTSAQMQCCGVFGPGDYLESAWKAESLARGDNVSKTCCRLRDETEADAHKNPRPVNETLCQNMDSKQSIYRHSQGCLDALEDFIRQESTLLIAVGCGVAGLEASFFSSLSMVAERILVGSGIEGQKKRTCNAIGGDTGFFFFLLNLSI